VRQSGRPGAWAFLGLITSHMFTNAANLCAATAAAFVSMGARDGWRYCSRSNLSASGALPSGILSSYNRHALFWSTSGRTHQSASRFLIRTRETASSAKSSRQGGVRRPMTMYGFILRSYNIRIKACSKLVPAPSQAPICWSQPCRAIELPRFMPPHYVFPFRGRCGWILVRGIFTRRRHSGLDETTVLVTHMLQARRLGDLEDIATTEYGIFRTSNSKPASRGHRLMTGSGELTRSRTPERRPVGQPALAMNRWRRLSHHFCILHALNSLCRRGFRLVIGGRLEAFPMRNTTGTSAGCVSILIAGWHPRVFLFATREQLPFSGEP